jgi:hypothetical protein
VRFKSERNELPADRAAERTPCARQCKGSTNTTKTENTGYFGQCQTISGTFSAFFLKRKTSSHCSRGRLAVPSRQIHVSYFTESIAAAAVGAAASAAVAAVAAAEETNVGCHRSDRAFLLDAGAGDFLSVPPICFDLSRGGHVFLYCPLKRGPCPQQSRSTRQKPAAWRTQP